MESKLWKVVEEINRKLDSKGIRIIQERQQQGRTIYGLKSQAVIDAVNEILGENWGYSIIESNVKELQSEKMSFYAYVRVNVFIDINGRRIERESYGGSRNSNIGDAIKGATTDAITKALSMFSIGRKAYEGELQEYMDCYRKIKGALQKKDKKALELYKQYKDRNKLGKLSTWSLTNIKEFCNLLEL